MDLEAIGVSDEKAAQYIDEMRTLRAWCYYNLFEVWGGALPLNTEVTSDVPPSADPDFDTSCKKIWQFMIDELDESLSNLPLNNVNRMNQATNRMIKARLLFNAEVFVKENHYTEAASICEDILNGKYGNYMLADDYRDIYNIDNVNCPEVVFALASEHPGLQQRPGPLELRDHRPVPRQLRYGPPDRRYRHGRQVLPVRLW